jgi:hypothetical protein
MKNPCLKTRPKSDPYESWMVPGVGIYHVLKKYKSPESEAKDPYALWFVWCENEYNDMGDMYAHEIMKAGVRIA